MSSNSNITNMRRLVDQLKLEASVERMKVSQAAAELQQYCLQNACKDALLMPGEAARPRQEEMTVMCPKHSVQQKGTESTML
ncbi:hypothetical protein AAFF_G00272560 [Aldrovandia affinis]|uniref:Guanine nucleotide-binding protein subunit gamma n=1 Tax=Aldrovandia affinis TaxID=143900 RepID=A0AAD7RBC5_9TELE|nr:hypothetical protein AAFF_G00272560 [Aldrovandia affinis]